MIDDLGENYRRAYGRQVGFRSGEPEGIFNFMEFCSLIGFDQVWAFEKKWAKR